MAKTTSDSILGVIQKESWILDHFEIFVNIALNRINMLGVGLRSPSAFLVQIVNMTYCCTELAVSFQLLVVTITNTHYD